MYILASISLLLAIFALGVLLWTSLYKRRLHNFCWHRLLNCNNYYVTVITPDRIKHVVDIFVVDRYKINKVEIDEIKPNYYRVQIPKGTTLEELRVNVSLDKVTDKTVISLFAGIKQSEKLDNLFVHKEDKNSCLEMFGYLKQTLQYS